MFKRLKIMAACALTFFSAHAYAQDTNNTDTAENAASASAENTAPEAEAVAGNAEAAQATVMTGGDIALPDDTAVPADAAPAEAATAEAATDAATDAAPADVAPAEAAEPEIMTDAILDKRLREVSTHVDTLKEDTFTTKSRLLLLREEVLQRSVSGARLQIRHKNDMGGQYELVQVYYALDNEPVFSKQDMTGELDDLDDEIIYDRMLAPGQHQLTVLYVYKGKAWGVFQYMKDYTFRVQSGYDFSIDEGKASELIVTADEKEGAFIPYEDRPSVTYQYEQFDLMPGSVLDDSAESSATASAEGAE
jgi:hypothetical protein